MLRYGLQRLGWTLVVFWAVSILTFAATILSPIDPARMYAGLHATESAVEAARKKFGLDQPVYVQYSGYVTRLLTGDLGRSFATRRPVLDSLLDRFPAPAQLAGAGVLG